MGNNISGPSITNLAEPLWHHSYQYDLKVLSARTYKNCEIESQFHKIIFIPPLPTALQKWVVWQWNSHSEQPKGTFRSPIFIHLHLHFGKEVGNEVQCFLIVRPHAKSNVVLGTKLNVGHYKSPKRAADAGNINFMGLNEDSEGRCTFI